MLAMLRPLLRTAEEIAADRQEAETTLPDGYRLLTEGERIREEDIYRTDEKWYRVGESCEKVIWTAQLYCPFARKV